MNRTARAMGISRPRIYFVFALRNALLPVVTMVGGVIGYLSSGTVLVESIFAWPGVGRYALDAIQRGFADTNHLFDRRWFPWEGEAAKARRYRTEPGVLLFRRPSDSRGRVLTLVLLVGETPMRVATARTETASVPPSVKSSIAERSRSSRSRAASSRLPRRTRGRVEVARRLGIAVLAVVRVVAEVDSYVRVELNLYVRVVLRFSSAHSGR